LSSQPRTLHNKVDHQPQHLPPSNILVKQHGKEAPIHAAMKADAMLEKGGPDGQRAWLRILKAIEVLLEDRPQDRVH
jgi:hypothetical protein